MQAAKEFSNPEHNLVKALWQALGQDLCETEAELTSSGCTEGILDASLLWEGGGGPAFLLGKLEVIVTLTRAGFIVWPEWEWAQREPWKKGVLTGGLEKLGGRTGPAVTNGAGHVPCSTTPHHLTALGLGSFSCKTLLGVAPSLLVLSISGWGHNHTPWAGACPLWHIRAATMPGSF